MRIFRFPTIVSRGGVKGRKRAAGRWNAAARFLKAAAFLFLVSFPSGRAMAGSVSAFVSILPQADFVERIGGDHVRVGVLVGPGRTPATYEPTPRQVAELARADVYFTIGVPFEKGFLSNISSMVRDLRIVDTREGVTLRYFGDSEGGDSPDPHIWLDPGRVKVQARVICEALIRLDPEHQAVFRERLQGFEARLDRLDKRIREILEPLRGRNFYVFHPAFGYFADAYGLAQIAVEAEGKEPAPKRLAALIRRAKQDGARALFLQPQHGKKQAMAVAREIGAKVVLLDPLPRDYVEGLESMAETIRKEMDPS